ncbi:hypothetical protein [Streptomyces sp. NPDC003006]
MASDQSDQSDWAASTAEGAKWPSVSLAVKSSMLPSRLDSLSRKSIRCGKGGCASRLCGRAAAPHG